MVSTGPSRQAPLRVFIADDSKPVTDMLIELISDAGRIEAGLAATRLLVTSNHISPQMKAGCIQLGADDYYDKVKELGKLTNRLAELADARGGSKS